MGDSRDLRLSTLLNLVTVVATGLDIFEDNLIRGLPRNTYIVYEKRNTIYMSVLALIRYQIN